MSTDNLLAELTSKTGLTETELNRQAADYRALMALCHPDAAGDLVSGNLRGHTQIVLINYFYSGDDASDSVCAGCPCVSYFTGIE